MRLKDELIEKRRQKIVDYNSCMAKIEQTRSLLQNLDKQAADLFHYILDVEMLVHGQKHSVLSDGTIKDLGGQI